MSDRTTEAILDATRASVLDFGIRRTTLTDVARRAGVSRMTVYRRYPDVDAVLRDLMTREFGAAMADVMARVGGGDGRTRLIGRVRAVIAAFRSSPVMAKVVEAEPELLLPYVLDRMGETQSAALALALADLADGQADGSIRAGDPQAMAHVLLLIGQSFVLSGGIADGVDEATQLDELERLLDAGLRP